MLVYDGDCGFCTSSAATIGRVLPDDVAIKPWQSLDLDQLQLTVADVTTAAYFVDPDGTLWRGHEAIGRTLEQGNRVLTILGRIIRTRPVSWIARPVYGWVAENRHRLPGSTEACAIR